MTIKVNQAAGILSLLDETSTDLKVYALDKLNEIVGIKFNSILFISIIYRLILGGNC
jgi:hypothetical protein